MYSIDLHEDMHSLTDRLGLQVSTYEDLLKELKDKSASMKQYVISYQGKTKSILITPENKELDIYLIRASDITDVIALEREKEEDLKAARDEARQANIEKDHFLARTSHDLRTPLGAIISLSKFGLDEAQDPYINQYFHDIFNSGSYMLDMLNDVLDLQKMESGEITLEHEVISVKEIESVVMTIVEPKAKEKSIMIEVNNEGNPVPYLIGDMRRIQQVIVNILTNAVKYTPEKGEIHVCGMIHQDHEDCWIEVIIADNGVGMSSGFMEHMFDPFAQEHNALSAKEGGTGLGLAIVKKLIDAMQGEIHVTSELGKGTTFTIKMPVDLPDEQMLKDYHKKHEGQSILHYDFAHRHLLVVEDNALNRAIIGKILESAHMTYESASDGQEGVEKALHHHYDAILMDIRMPGMDGLKASEMIRLKDTKTPIIAISANAYPEDIEKSRQAGMNAHLTKPIEVEKLFETLTKLL